MNSITVSILIHLPYIAGALFGVVAFLLRAPRLALLLFLGSIVISPFGFVGGAESLRLSPVEVMLLSGVAFAALRGLQVGRVPRLESLLIGFIAFYSIRVLLSMGESSWNPLLLARDARPILNIACAIFLVRALPIESMRIRSRQLLAVLVTAVSVDVLYYFFGLAIGLEPAGILGTYYERTHILRYMDIGSLTLFGLSCYAFYLERGTLFRAGLLGVMTIVAFLSLSRVFLLAVAIFVGLFLFGLLHRLLRNRFAAVSSAVLVASLALLVVTGPFQISSTGIAPDMISRLDVIASPARLIEGIEYRVIQPALKGGYEFTAGNLVIGEGPGFTFSIPWFEYRGLETDHSSVDSYLILYLVKYGVVGAALLSLLLIRMLPVGPLLVGNIWLLFYLAVNSGLNVSGFILFMLMAYAVRSSRILLFSSGST